MYFINALHYMFSSPANPVNLNCYNCKQSYTIEESDTPMCPVCNIILAFKSKCNRCDKNFWSRFSKKIKCYLCEKYHKCIYCDNETLNIKCDTCSTITLYCHCCSKEITTEFIYLFTKPYHNKCCDRIKNMNSDFYENKYVKVSYVKNTIVHDGYCSDPYDEEEIVKYVSKVYPLSKVFDINEKISLNLNDERVRIYQITSKGCKLGSNYCGNGTTYELIEVEFIQ